MTKEKSVVTDVKQVVSSIRKKIQQGEGITLKDVDDLSSNVNKLISDYNTAIENYLAMDSLVVKQERFKEVIGIIEYASASDVEILDKAIELLSQVMDSYK